jgi:hypothetical protein
VVAQPIFKFILRQVDKVDFMLHSIVRLKFIGRQAHTIVQ